MQTLHVQHYYNTKNLNLVIFEIVVLLQWSGTWKTLFLCVLPLPWDYDTAFYLFSASSAAVAKSRLGSSESFCILAVFFKCLKIQLICFNIFMMNVCGVAKSCAMQHLDQVQILGLYIQSCVFIILTVSEINEGFESFQKNVCVCVRKRVWKSVTDFYSFSSLSSGHCVFKVHISLLSDSVLLLSYWRNLFHDQSTNCKGQGCDFCIPLPVFLQACTWS